MSEPTTAARRDAEARAEEWMSASVAATAAQRRTRAREWVCGWARDIALAADALDFRSTDAVSILAALRCGLDALGDVARAEGVAVHLLSADLGLSDNQMTVWCGQQHSRPAALASRRERSAAEAFAHQADWTRRTWRALLNGARREQQVREVDAAAACSDLTLRLHANLDPVPTVDQWVGVREHLGDTVLRDALAEVFCGEDWLLARACARLCLKQVRGFDTYTVLRLEAMGESDTRELMRIAQTRQALGLTPVFVPVERMFDPEVARSLDAYRDRYAPLTDGSPATVRAAERAHDELFTDDTLESAPWQMRLRERVRIALHLPVDTGHVPLVCMRLRTAQWWEWGAWLDAQGIAGDRECMGSTGRGDVPAWVGRSIGVQVGDRTVIVACYVSGPEEDLPVGATISWRPQEGPASWQPSGLRVISSISRAAAPLGCRVASTDALFDGPADCDHGGSHWDWDGFAMALVRDCPTCGRTRLEVVPAHQLERTHPRGLRTPWQEMRYLMRWNTLRQLDGLPLDGSLAEARARDGLRTLGAVRRVDELPENLLFADED